MNKEVVLKWWCGMKCGIKIYLVLLVMLPLAAMAEEVLVGDSKEDVLSALGEPRGRIASGEYELLDYERGRIELQDGKVVSVDLMSPRQLARSKAEAARRREEERRREEQRRRERHRRGL